MRTLQALIGFLGRTCVSIIFISSAFHKILDWQATERGLFSLLCDWQIYVSYSLELQRFFGSLLQWVPSILVVVTAIELIGGFMVLLGLKPRLGAFFLLIFFVPITILFHQFWFLEGIRREMQITIFLKNIAIMGALLIIIAFNGKTEKKKLMPNISLESPNIDE